ncbi:DUF6082 family protein [Actinoplanes sp. NPDC049599]|uniref:DUF6082 family protein n=1 Tax=Actinoplanes sp. NPDC049599 TaxID=3363903 RepID=UPI00379F8ECB
MIILAIALTAGAGIVIWSPLLMYRLLGESLPWPRLADVGQAYGGASALLSAAALSAIGGSLLLQSRQVRQDLLNLHKQQHFELVKLGLENPDFFEVLDGSPLAAEDRRKVYANLVLTYWMTMWELGEIADAELRNLTSTMFRSRVARDWWRQVNEHWTTVRGRRRRQFLRVVHEEWASADTREGAAPTRRAVHGELPESDLPRSRAGNPPARISCLAATVVAVGFVANRLIRRRVRRGRQDGPAHRP